MAEGEGLGSIRFGPFELSLATHELSKHGTRLRLRGQSIEVLELLIARPGEIVTRDELRHQLWPNEGFGDFEHGLNAAVNKLREALCDSATQPKYVETVPGRGYRFISKVESPTPVPPAPPPDTHPNDWRRPVAVTLVMFVVAGVAYWVVRSIIFPPPPILSEGVWVLIADFESLGDDPLPQAVVREGLTVTLQQSRYVNVFSRSEVQEVLKEMEKAPDTRVDEATGREICQRRNLQVLLTGSIENLNEVFEVTVRAIDPGKGTLFFAEKAQFKKEEFFEKVDALAKLVRKDLGESRKGIDANSLPLAEVTTHDLQALQLYSQASNDKDQGKLGDVPALLQAAIARDPEFAMAHWLMADVYETIGNRAEKLEHLRQALEHRDRLTYREACFIQASYDMSIERADEAVNVLTPFVALYPQDPEGHTSLAFAYYNLGELDNSIKQLNEVIRIDPHSAPAYGQLMLWLARNNAPEEALNLYHKAQVKGVASPGIEWGAGMAFWNEGKVAEAQEHFRNLQTPGSLYSSIGRIYFARTLIYQGKLADAGAQLRDAIIVDHAAQNSTAERLEHYLLGSVALTDGNRAEARLQLQLILAAGGPPPPEAVELQGAGALYAQMGDLASARNVLGKLKDLLTTMPSPSDSAYRDNLAGEIALAEARSTEAERLFSASLAAYPLALSHQGLARVYEAQQNWPMAAKEWEAFLNSRGEVFQDDYPADWVLAHVFFARVKSLHLKDIDGARTEYKKFLGTWEESDHSSFVQQFVREAQQATN
jgi:DNA-binding winged helix-turn-helix (wHTH) protein/tetratricopeptide (TPR) repeat protein